MATLTRLVPESLPNRAVIALTGDGILAFLHNILTCNVEHLGQRGLAYGALLSPQGKILHDIFVHNAGDAVLIDCEKAGRDDLLAKLKLYRLRAKFQITPRDDMEVVAGAGSHVDPRLAALGARGIFALGSHPLAAAYDTLRYDLGIADSAEIGSNRLFPHEANFDQLNAVDFSKGCYIGQEVVSRMQHRGTARSRILPVTFESEFQDYELRADDILLGEVLGRRERKALALLRLDRLAEARQPLPFIVMKPEWGTFEVAKL